MPDLESIPEEMFKGDCDDSRMIIFHGRRIRNLEILTTELKEGQVQLRENQEEMMVDLKDIKKSLEQLGSWKDVKDLQNGNTTKRMDEIEHKEEQKEGMIFTLKSGVLIGVVCFILGVFGGILVEILKFVK